MRISSKGWVVIPAELREKYGLEPGDEVRVIDYGGVLSLVPVSEDPIEHAAGMLGGEGRLTAALTEEHRKEIKRGR